MIFCGIKITHDGGIALIEDGVLKLSIEMEKINNNPRYSSLGNLDNIEKILGDYGYTIDMVDHFAVDGWHGIGAHWRGDPILEINKGMESIKLTVAPYNESSLKDNVLVPYHFKQALPLGQKGVQYDYVSYMHVAGHISSAYCSSPFAKKNQSSYVLVWDGGQYPRLYYVDSKNGTIQNLGHLFFLLGTIYSIMGHYYGPYKKTEEQMQADREQMTIEGYFGGYSIAGKLMSYIAFGQVNETLIKEMHLIYKREIEISNIFEHKFMMAVRDYANQTQLTDADILASIHVFLEQMLLENLRKKVRSFPDFKRNLCFAGGSALNIKWNSKIRGMNLFHDLWVPPFPNDAGSAIGVACSAMMDIEKKTCLTWNVYSGPKLIQQAPEKGWTKQACDINALAEFISQQDEPVLFLNGPAELGPRALGNRSILAAPTSSLMQKKINFAKKREEFRPVAPICLEAYAAEVFNPGDDDPYMLFDHKVRDNWTARVPAIVHLDGTARLQTVNQEQNPTVWQLLSKYHQLTGIPLLCNTSANFNGAGFFPDVESAARWGRLNFIWAEGMLYEKTDKVVFPVSDATVNQEEIEMLELPK